MPLHVIEELLVDDWIVIPSIPLPAANRILEPSCIERVMENLIDHAESQILASACPELRLLHPSIYVAAAHAILRDLLEHLSDERRSHRINDNSTTPFTSSPLCEISKRWKAGAITLFVSGFLSALHIDTSIIIFELCLRTKNHEQKFLVRVIRELL